MQRQIRRTFPAPQADPGVEGSGEAIEAGEDACEGKTPIEVKQHYYPLAIEAEGLDPDSPQAKMIAGIARYEGSPDASFTAGQLAAGAYEATLEGELASYGYQGCVYALARGLEGR